LRAGKRSHQGATSCLPGLASVAHTPLFVNDKALGRWVPG
jgi:hypothetical protein